MFFVVEVTYVTVIRFLDFDKNQGLRLKKC